MKEAIINKGPKFEIRESPIPVPELSQIVTKVVVSGSNPKDRKRPEWGGEGVNQGDDIAGVIHAVGSNVVEFHPGDRGKVEYAFDAVNDHGSYQNICEVLDHKIEKITFETARRGIQRNPFDCGEVSHNGGRRANWHR